MMAAAFLRISARKSSQSIFTKSIAAGPVLPKRDYGQADVPKSVETGQQINSVAKSLASKGYLRAQRPYDPPADVAQIIGNICKKVNLADNDQSALSIESKFTILTACAKKFSHSVPNSMIHEMNSIDNIITFYETPISTTLPLDAIKTMELPKNLHIQNEYVRFDPETDTMFNGKTAFPKSSTIISGLKAKKKYKGHIVKKSWP